MSFYILPYEVYFEVRIRAHAKTLTVYSLSRSIYSRCIFSHTCSVLWQNITALGTKIGYTIAQHMCVVCEQGVQFAVRQQVRIPSISDPRSACKSAELFIHLSLTSDEASVRHSSSVVLSFQDSFGTRMQVLCPQLCHSLHTRHELGGASYTPEKELNNTKRVTHELQGPRTCIAIYLLTPQEDKIYYIRQPTKRSPNKQTSQVHKPVHPLPSRYVASHSFLPGQAM